MLLQKKTRLFLALIMALSMVSIGMDQAALAAGPLSGADLQRLFPGKFNVVVKEVHRITVTAKADGSLVGKALGKKDHGKWYVSGSELCVTLNKWLKGKTRCSAVTEEAGWYYSSGVRFQSI